MFEIIMNIFMAILLIVFVICWIGLICCLNNTLYCYVFENKDWRKWKEIIAMADKFEFEFKVKNNYHFIEPSNTYRISVWRGEMASIHTESDGECICSSYDHYHSKKLAKILMAKIA